MAYEDSVKALLGEIGVAYHRLKVTGDALHAQLGVTTSMRGVLETLEEFGPATVPQVARRRSVSRQHIQSIVDTLWERKLCSFAPNAAHARSPVVELTPKGSATLETLRECEQPLVVELASGLPADVATAVAVLRRLNAALLRRLPD
jgi:DNA-binding MarR family transcriptional regulator